MYERRPGTWELRKQCGRRADGTPRIVNETFHGTEDAARAELSAIGERMGVTDPEADGLTLSGFWDRYYLPGLRGQGRTESTIRGYTSSWEHHVRPTFGDREMASITHAEVRRWVASIDRPVAARKAYACLRQVMRTAWDYGMLEDEPMRRRVPLPKVDRGRPDVWGAAEVSEALGRLRGHELEPVFLVMAGGGLRREEAMALCRDDMRFEGALGMDGHEAVTCFVRVDKAYTRDDGMKPTKTRQSVRTVAVGEPFSSRLLSCMPGEGPIVAGPQGQRADPDAVSQGWRRLFVGGPLEGLPYVPLNHLRHTHVTLMLAAGVDPATTAKAHGHSQQVEYGHYFAPEDDAMERAARLVEDEIRRSS
jgi:integrase